MPIAQTICFLSLIGTNLLIALLAIGWSTYYRGKDAWSLLLLNAVAGLFAHIATIPVALLWPGRDQDTLWVSGGLLVILSIMHVGSYCTAYSRINQHAEQTTEALETR